MKTVLNISNLALFIISLTLFAAFTMRVKTDEPLYSPLKINDPSVLASSLYYRIEGNIIGILDADGGKQITTDIYLENLPLIIVNQQTPLFFVDKANNGFSKPATINDLQTNQTIRIFLLYGLKQKKWFIPRVNIVTSTATPLPNSPTNEKVKNFFSD